MAALFISIILGIWFLSRAAREHMAGREDRLRLADVPERILLAAEGAAPGLQASGATVKAGKAGMPLYSITGSLSGVAVRVDVSFAGDVLAVAKLENEKDRASGHGSRRLSPPPRSPARGRGKRGRVRKDRRRKALPSRLPRPGWP